MNKIDKTNRSIIINDGGSTVITADWTVGRNIEGKVTHNALRVTSIDYRNNELIRLCKERKLKSTQHVIGGKCITDIEGLESFSEAMDIIIAFRKNF